MGRFWRWQRGDSAAVEVKRAFAETPALLANLRSQSFRSTSQNKPVKSILAPGKNIGATKETLTADHRQIMGVGEVAAILPLYRALFTPEHRA